MRALLGERRREVFTGRKTYRLAHRIDQAQLFGGLQGAIREEQNLLDGLVEQHL